ncbi:MAG: YgjV family protein [Acidobacteria bacterium]|nr:YgjV family protein [Acidobacteriota bacterium]
MFEWIGWVATAVFAISYFCRRPALLRRTQALAALLWIGYGLIIKAPPVIVANMVVAVMAVLSSFQRKEQFATKASAD